VSTTEKTEPGKPGWAEINQQYLSAELRRLRLLLQRRVLWLRKVWKREVAAELQSFQGLVITDAEADMFLDSETVARERRFYDEDAEALDITRQLAEQQLLVRKTVESIAATGALPALDILARLFRLGEFRMTPPENMRPRILRSRHWGFTATAKP
jgi:hypothetical protein